MKKYGTLIAFGLAVACGALAVWLTSQWLQARAADDQTAKEAVPMVSVVIAAQDIAVGTTLTAENLTVTQWPKTGVPKGAFESVEAVAGRVAVTRIAAGVPLFAAELADANSGVGLVALIPPGRRAMSIRVDEVSGVAGFILPNTYVDVISVIYGTQQRTGQDREVKTILKKVKVLATAQETTNDKGKAKVVNTVTLEILPKEAEVLVLHATLGSIHLVLRNPLEEIDAEPPPPPVEKAVAKKRKAAPVQQQTVAPAPPPPQPTTYSVEVIKGSKSPEKVKFKSANSDERL